jgi:hypothetical protein
MLSLGWRDGRRRLIFIPDFIFFRAFRQAGFSRTAIPNG